MSSRFQRDPSLNSTYVHRKLAEGHEGAILALVDRRPTAAASVKAFFDTVDIVKKNNSQKFTAIRMPAVGLKIENRSSAYDLFYVVSNFTVYAVDCEDDSFVAYMILPPMVSHQLP